MVLNRPKRYHCITCNTMVPFYAGTKKQCWYPPHFYGTNPRYQPHLYGANNKGSTIVVVGVVVVVVVVVGTIPEAGRGSPYIRCALGLGLGLWWVSRGLVPGVGTIK